MTLAGVCGITAVLCLTSVASAHAQIEIDSIETLQRIGYDPDYPLTGSYVLIDDIDASPTQYWNNGTGFFPIGQRLEDDESAAFMGQFDGRGFVIRNLFINRPEEHGIGLFGSIASCAIVANVRLEGGSITGGYYVGGLVGENWSASLYWCSSTATVSGISRVGGLVGINRGTIDGCYAAGPVSGKSFIGGLVGRNHVGTVIECYSAGSVAGGLGTGGLVGNAVESEAIASFWDSAASGISVSAGGESAATEDLVQPQIFLDADWNFVDVWTILPGTSYPYLR